MDTSGPVVVRGFTVAQAEALTDAVAGDTDDDWPGDWPPRGDAFKAAQHVITVALDGDAEPAAVDVPAVDADTDDRAHRGTVAQVLVMHDASGHAKCGRAPAGRRAPIGISAVVRTLATTAWARVALDDHCDGQTFVRRVRVAL